MTQPETPAPQPVDPPQLQEIIATAIAAITKDVQSFGGKTATPSVQREIRRLVRRHFMRTAPFARPGMVVEVVEENVRFERAQVRLEIAAIARALYQARAYKTADVGSA